MTLQEFVKETLLNVVNGVADAKHSNPNVASPENSLPRESFLIEFDVAVTVTEKSGLEGKGGISVLKVFNAGGTHSTASEQSSASRVKFSVPVDYKSRR